MATKTRYVVITKLEAGWATVYVGTDKALADQIFDRETKLGREVHIAKVEKTGGAS